MEMAESDPDIFVQKSAVKALGALHDPRSDLLLRAISVSNNRFLAGTAKNSLRSSRRLQT
jgi:HEAT repeat protein